MTIEVETIRPQGIRRKILNGVETINTQDTTGTDRIGAYFPRQVLLVDIGYLCIDAQSANASSTTINVGVASGGDTIIDGFALTDSEALGNYTSMIDTPGTNGGLRVIPAGTTIFWEHVTADADGGYIALVLEYIDRSD